jgi:hypothetical protein
MFPTILKENFQSFHSVLFCFLQIFQGFLVNAGNSLFNVMFKVLEVLQLLLWTLFTRNLRRKISSGIGLGTWWPKTTPDKAVTKEVLQESSCFYSVGKLET